MFCYYSGLAIFLLAALLFAITGSEDIEPVLIGMGGFCILWIFGMQYDLYEIPKKKKGDDKPEKTN